ncbi:MAG: hypothetical protein ABSG69_16105 [Candidatus Acidiferrum sp.]|jgi:hypothetical protein
MGNEITCTVKFGKQRSEGKALLETNELIFRGDFRLRIPFAAMKSVEAVKGELRVHGPDGLAVFDLGENAAKWHEKIRHPKSRIEKLGVKPDARVAVLGKFDEDFLRELSELSDNVDTAAVGDDAEWIFFAAPSKKELAGVRKHAKKMAGSVALWVVYPKGQKDIRESDVLAMGRDAGLKDVKVVGFSPTHTALKFVIPLADR